MKIINSRYELTRYNASEVLILDMEKIKLYTAKKSKLLGFNGFKIPSELISITDEVEKYFKETEGEFNV